jgi:tight adherence protein C
LTAMAEIIAITTFLLLTAGICYYGFRVYARPSPMLAQLRELPQRTAAKAAGEGEEGNWWVRFVHWVGEKLPISPNVAGTTRRQLVAAGFRSESATRMFYGCKAVFWGVLSLSALAVVSSITNRPRIEMMILFAAGCLGWFGPGMTLDWLVKRRQDIIRVTLPDALDLLVVCVEAGHGLDQAIVRVTRELRATHKDICDEFALMTLEMRAGKRRAEALHNLAERTAEPELRKLVAIMIQADRFGTSIGESLRTHADYMREKRKQDAEERANKVGVKMVFPIFFFILPSMFVVTAGPGLLAIINNLVPALGHAGGH